MPEPSTAGSNPTEPEPSTPSQEKLGPPKSPNRSSDGISIAVVESLNDRMKEANHTPDAPSGENP